MSATAAMGVPQDTVASTDTGDASLIQLMKRLNQHFTTQDALIGEVQATPTSNTLLRRLKDLLSLIVLAAGTNLIGKVSSGMRTDKLYNDTTEVTPVFLKIAASSSGNNNLVAAQASNKIRVLAYHLSFAGTVNAKFQQDGASSPLDLTGLEYGVANVQVNPPFSPLGLFETAANKTLDINLSTNVAVGGWLVYVLI